MEISLLLPTRGRAGLLRRFFDSLLQTTEQLECVEIVLYVDADDSETEKVTDASLAVSKVVGPPGQTMGRMNRACYEASRGRHLILMNDDVVFRTPGWDQQVIRTFGEWTDGIGLVYGDDLDQGAAVPTFPILSRTVCEVLGEICPAGYHHLHIESHLFDIFKQLRKLGHDRIRYLEGVIFEHMHYVVRKAQWDSTYAKKNQRIDDLLFIALDEERAWKAKQLARYIERGPA